jgi:hypothetical protein
MCRHNNLFELARQMEAAHRTNLAKGEVGTRERKKATEVEIPNEKRLGHATISTTSEVQP